MESRSERHRHAATHSVGRRAVGAAVVVLLAGGATYAFTQRGVNAEAPGAGTSAAYFATIFPKVARLLKLSTITK